MATSTSPTSASDPDARDAGGPSTRPHEPGREPSSRPGFSLECMPDGALRPSRRRRRPASARASESVGDGSGLPVPRRRTFTPALRASAHSELTALRHPWLRLSATPALGARAAPHGYSGSRCNHMTVLPHCCVAWMRRAAPETGGFPDEMAGCHVRRETAAQHQRAGARQAAVFRQAFACQTHAPPRMQRPRLRRMDATPPPASGSSPSKNGRMPCFA
jgi:hypothetical protein